MKRKLVVLVESPLNVRDYERFGIAYLAETYDVLVADCTCYVYPHLQDSSQSKTPDTHRLECVAHRADVRRIAQLFSFDVAFDFLGESLAANIVRRELIKVDVLRVVFRLGELHFTCASRGSRVMSLLKKLIHMDVYARIFKRITMRADVIVAKIPPVNMTVMGGTSGANAANGDVIYAHSFDYERWRSLSLPTAKSSDRYAVFLDEDIVYHPDYAKLGVLAPVTEEAYFPAMNRLFDAFERHTGVSVRVAVHPRSRYKERPHLWGARQLIYGDTPVAVANSCLVFAHFSTSISFAILSFRPIVHLVSDELLKSFMGLQILGVSSFLGTRLINIDHACSQVTDLNSFEVDEPKYAAYKDCYLKADKSAEAPLWEIVLTAIDRKLAPC